MDTDKNNDGSVELKGELAAYIMSEGQAKLAKTIEGLAKSEGIPQEVAQEYYNKLSEDTDLVKQVFLGGDEKAEAIVAEYITEETQRALNTVVADITQEDGTHKTINYGDFLVLITSALEKGGSDTDAADKLRIILASLLEYAKSQPGILENPIAAKTLEALRKVYEYLQKGIEPPEEIDKFLQGAKDYILVPRPVGIENLIKVYDNKKNAFTVTKEFNDMNITYSGAFGWDEQTLLQLMLAAITNMNPHRAKDNLRTRVELPLTRTMELLERTVTKANKRKFASDLRTTILKNMNDYSIDIRFKKDGSFEHKQFGAGEYGVSIGQDLIKFKVGDTFAGWLNSAHKLGQYSNLTLSIGNKSNPLPRALATKMQYWYFDDDNRAKGTHNILSIRSLLNFAEYLLPDYHTLFETKNERHWKDRIRDKLEAALDEIQEKGLFEWEYCKAGMAEATPQETQTNDYSKWSKLYITFKLIPEEPDQTERLERKQARLEAAQEKQDLKEAETIVEAEKIKARNRKKRGASATKKQ